MKKLIFSSFRIKRFSDSHYTTPAHIAPLEERGLQGDMILVEGVRTGSAKVSTRLRDPVYKVSYARGSCSLFLIYLLFLCVSSG